MLHEVLKFLREVEKAVLKKQEISRILNNYAPGHGLDRAIEADLPALPPTSASWQNRVERCPRDYIQTFNEPQSLVWTKPRMRFSKKWNEPARRWPPLLYNHYYVQDTTLEITCALIHRQQGREWASGGGLSLG